jgi:hypothetical protein
VSTLGRVPDSACRASAAARARDRSSRSAVSECSRVRTSPKDPAVNVVATTTAAATVVRARTDPTIPHRDRSDLSASIESSSAVYGETVSDHPYRLQAPASERLVDAGSELVDVDLDDVGIAVEGEVPDVPQDVGFRHHVPSSA